MTGFNIPKNFSLDLSLVDSNYVGEIMDKETISNLTTTPFDWQKLQTPARLVIAIGIVGQAAQVGAVNADDVNLATEVVVVVVKV